MCKWLLDLFIKKTADTAGTGSSVVISEETPTVSTVETTTVTLPHPEEAKDATATVENTDIYEVMTEWLRDWAVPEEYWEYWRTAIVIELYDTWPVDMLNLGLMADTPAATWDQNGVRHLASLAKWFNPGVIAHEQAHNAYALLPEAQKAEFEALYTPLKDTDELIKYLYSINTYGLTSVIEGHAEVYRYLGGQMPENLKQFYPKLF